MWLVVTTGFHMLQLGLAQSLYFCIPRKDGRAKEWLTQATLSLLTSGVFCGLALYAGRFLIAKQFGNPELATFGLPMALIAAFMIAGSPLEMLVITNSIVATEPVREARNIRQVTIAPLMAEAIRRISEERSVSSLFD